MNEKRPRHEIEAELAALDLEILDDEFRRKAEQSHMFFCTHVLGYRDLEDDLHGTVSRIVNDNTKRKKLLLLPRGHLKSSLITIGWTLWRIVQDPNRTFGIFNETQDLVEAFLREMKDHLEGPVISKYWPHLVPPKDERKIWNRQAIILNRDLISRTPTIEAKSVEESTAGRHPDVMILDDPISDRAVRSESGLAKSKQKFRELQALLEPPSERDPIKGTMIVIGTRWHWQDLYSHIMEKLSDYYDIHIRRAIEDGQCIFPKKFSKKILKEMRETMGEWVFCTPGETPVTMADFSSKQIEDIQIGDEVLGYYRRTDDDRPQYNRLAIIPSEVIDKGSQKEEALEFQMESGRIVRCTENHHWYTGRSGSDGHRMYSPLKVNPKAPEPGTGELRFVCNPFVRDVEDKWLGGFFDGEGTTSTGVSFSQTMGKNFPVCEMLRSELAKHGYEWGEYIDPRDDGSGQKLIATLKGGWTEVCRFLQQFRPARSQEIINYLYRRGTNRMRDSDRAVSVRSIGIQKVYWLETTTGNYVAWGYASKNSAQMLNEPVDSEAQLFPHELLVSRKWKGSKEKLVERLPCKVYLSVDPAWEGEDATGIVVGARAQNGKLYILEAIRSKLKPDDMLTQVVMLATQWRVARIGFEGVVGGQEWLIKNLRDRLEEHRVSIPVVSISHQNRSKDARILGLQPELKYRRLYIHESCEQLFTEFLQYPRSSFRDLMDATEMLTRIATPPGKTRELKASQIPGTAEWELSQMEKRGRSSRRGRFSAR